jgi:hypothetical protein
MKKLFWLAVGITAGVAVAKQVRENPKAKALLNDATDLVKDFGAALSEGFAERSAEIAAEEAKAAAKPATNSASK